MAFDNLVLAKIAQKLATILKDSYLGEPYALGTNQYAIPFHGSKALKDISKGHGDLILYFDPNTPFVAYSTGKFAKTVDNTPFFNSLRKLVGTQVLDVKKEKGERVITIDTANVGRELGDLNQGFSLVVELFPSRPNAFLIAHPYDKIIGLFKEVGDITSQRYLTRNVPYNYPPEREVFTSGIESVDQAKGILANEVLKKLKARAEAIGFAEARDELLNDPGLYYEKGTILPSSFGDPKAEKVEVFDIYDHYVANQRLLAKELREKDLIDKLDRAVKTVRRKIKNMEEDYQESEKRLAYKDYGNLLFLYQTQYRPGLKEMVLEGHAITLDPDKNVIENANLYFKKYRKAKQAVVTLKELEAKAQDELVYLEKKLQEVPLAGNRDLLELKEELVFEGYLKDPSRKGKALRKRKAYDPHIIDGPDQTRIGFGMNGLQNETLTFQVAKPNDLFLHIKDYPGSHVVILDGRSGDPEKLFAAELALFLSGKDSGDVMITPRKYVKKNSNKLGLVNVLKYQTITLKKIRQDSLTIFKKALKTLN